MAIGCLRVDGGTPREYSRVALPSRTRWTTPDPTDRSARALEAERARLLDELGEAIEAPDQMTYGSQAAAASQVFEQQRDLALRDRATSSSRRSTPRSRGSTAAPSGRACDCGRPIAPDAARGAAVGGALHRLPDRARDRRAPMTTPTPRPDLVTLEAIRAAADALRGVTIRDAARRRSGRPEDRRWLKAESLQPIGAFKLRGAYVAIAALDRRRARARRHHLLVGQPRPGRRPRGAPARRPGRRRHAVGRARHQARAGRGGRRRGRRSSARPPTSASGSPRDRRGARRWPIIPPYDDDRIIAGQGTIGLEIVEDLPDVAARPRPDRRRRAGQRRRDGGQGAPAGGPGHRRRAGARGRRPRSLARGEIVRWPAEQVSRTIADGTRTQAIGERTFAHLRAYLDAIVTVSEAEIAAGVRLAAERSRLVVEPSGALSIAALAFHAARARPRRARRRGRRRSSAAATSTRSGTATTWRAAPPRLSGRSAARRARRSSASRSASRARGLRISASSTAARGPAAARLARLGPHPAPDEGHDRRRGRSRRRRST